MFTIEKKSWTKYFLFGGLYFTQGILLTVAWIITPIYFEEKGVSPQITTLAIGVAMTPAIIKFVWGGIVDYFNRFGRKRFITLGGTQFALGLFAVAFIDPGVSVILFTFFLFNSFCGMVFLDVSVDGWVIEISREEERGKINGSMFAGLYSGMTFSSLLLSFIARTIGYSISFIAAGLFVIIIIILFSTMVKKITTVEKSKKIRALLIDEFKKKTTKLISIFALILQLSGGVLLVVVPLYMKKVLQLDIGEIGLISALFPLTTAIGSVVGGIKADTFGRKNTMYVFIWVSVFFSVSLIFANTWQVLVILYGIVGFLGGGYFAAFSAMLMDITNPKIGATQYSIFASLSNAGLTGGEAVSGSLVAILGFGRVFLFSGWLLGPVLMLLYFIRVKGSTRRI